MISEDEARTLDDQFWADLYAMRQEPPLPVDPSFGAGYRGKSADMGPGHEHRLHRQIVPCHNGSRGMDPGLFA